MDLNEFQQHPLLEGWEGHVAPPLLETVRTLFRSTTDQLISLGEAPQESQVMRILQTCTEKLNELDETQGPFIMTIEREELCELIDQLAAACGIEPDEPVADNWRDW